MAERREIEAISCEFELPEHIIQHIQSFLTGKAAARTAVLCKSWRNAWLTRPNIDFDFEDSDGLLELANKTIQRYQESNLKIESFRLHLDSLQHDDFDLANTLILKALRLCSHLCFKILRGQFVIGREVFESENLKRLVLSTVELDTLFFRDMSSKFPSLKDLTLKDLSVGRCTFDVGMDQINLRCSRLQSLSLNSVEIESRDMISKIILSCPLIENMSLSNIRDKQYYEPVISVPISLPKLHNIKRLVLCRMQFDTLFFYDSSSKFPFLKDLTLNGFWHSDEEGEDIQISSHSLEHLNLAPDCWTSNWTFKLDVPSIHKFTFEGRYIPSVSFKLTSREWESHISINFMDTIPLDTSWFHALNELLTALIPSKIYLSIDGRIKKCLAYEVRDITQGLPQHEVENLTVDIRYLPTLNCYALFDGIFRACRPKIITQYLLPDPYLTDKTNSDFLCMTLAQGVNGEFSSPRNFMYGLNGLKEVNVQVFDEFVAAWKDLPFDSLLEALESPEENKKIRFQLLWKP